ncbi:MAG TPA: dihydrolipoamide acetyltransferase family protein [Gemmatimonadales bacterium]|nr:dihydrolipoamide acetyltransferase family protein [Gemmatimonadales bacterium]
MSRIDVVMPQMGESITEGTLSRWLKKVGDPIKRDEPMFEISTDKVDAEIPAPAAGTLAEVLVQEGQTVAVQTVVARIETEAGAVAAAPPSPAPAPAPAPTPAPAPAPGPAAAPTPAATPIAATPIATVPVGNGAETAEERLRRRSTPLVRKMAAEHNLDLASIPGSGVAGRVTKNDVVGYLESGQAARTAQPAPAPAPARAPEPQPVGPPARPAPAVAADPWQGDTVEPWSRIRRLTAEHMVMSRRVSPHVNTIFEIDYTRVSQLRAKQKAEYAARGVNLTYLAFIAKAAADNLRKHPGINAAVGADATILRRDINLGIAVALDWGLIVPVVRHADELSLMGVARAINDLGERARGKKLTPEEVQKGTFTITNPGVFGSVIGTPIINQPQVAILCVGAIQKQPAVVSIDGADALAVRLMGMLSLAFDHRVVDGADADRFMADMKRTLEEFPEGAT